jgi:dUTP pyrophosphatase
LAQQAALDDLTYRGEVMINALNLTQGVWTISRGDRIAQMVLAPIITPEFMVVLDLPATARGEGGFGSTGR